MSIPPDGRRLARPLSRLVFAAAAAVGGLCILSQTPAAHANTLQTNIFISVCGNGIVEGDEVCDDGSANNTGAYGSTTPERHCLPDCTGWGPYCGDGILQARFSEQCDLGGNNGGSSLCSLTCQSVPAVPPSSPPQVLGNTPYVPGATAGNIPATTQTQVILRGKAYPSGSVEVLENGNQIGTAQSDSNANFQYSTTQVTPGTATFSFIAQDYAGVESLITSVVFAVVSSAITSVNNIYIPPTISTSARQVAPGDPLTLFGQSVPGAIITTQLDSDTRGTLNATADGSGKWALELDTNSVSPGFHSAKTLFVLSTSTQSGWGKSVSFFIGASLPAGGPTPDLNGDGKVNLIDFSIFLLSWNTSDPRADFNQDGTVNLADFSIMLFDWTG